MRYVYVAPGEFQRHAGIQFDLKVVEAFLLVEPPAAPPPDGTNLVTGAIRGQAMS